MSPVHPASEHEKADHSDSNNGSNRCDRPQKRALKPVHGADDHTRALRITGYRGVGALPKY